MSAWKLTLFGDFRLSSPAGEEIEITSHKVKGLLAMLAVSKGIGLERTEVTSNLWPGSKSDANLRQAVHQLRKFLGYDAVRSTSTSVLLAPGFPLETDFNLGPQTMGAEFMPGYRGEWFEQIRLEAAAFDDDVSLEKEETVVSHFLQTMRWFSKNDPHGMFAILGSSPSMGRSISYKDMSELLSSTKGHEGCLGWAAYWRGTVENDLEVCVGHLRLALRIARQTNDLPLASEACLELGKAYARTGRLEKALRLCDIADDVAGKSTARTAITNALRLRGTVLLNWHNPVAGLDLFMQAQDRIEDPIEFAFTLNARAFFEASLGLYEKSEVTLAQSLALSRSLGHFRIGMVSDFTRTILDASRGSRSGALDELVSQSKSFYVARCTQFGVYAEEFVARLYLLDGDRGAAASMMSSARKERHAAQMTVTPLEAKRVAVVASR